MFGSPGLGIRSLTNSCLKLGTGDCPLSAPLRDQFPKIRTASKFHLFGVKTGDTYDKSNGFPLPSNHDVFVLRFVNAGVKACLFQTDDFHRVPQSFCVAACA